MDIETLVSRHPRISLTPLPTPLYLMKNLSDFLGGPRIYVKRDDIGSLEVGKAADNILRQAIECIAITMAVYLSISLLISLLMNMYNRRMALVER